jgi:hypothetical protein
MRALKQLYYLAVIAFLFPIGLILRLFGWRPEGETGIQSLFQREYLGSAVVSAKQSEKKPYPYIYVNEDGSARELHKRQRQYLETPFLGCDGGRPYVKWRYKQEHAGDIKGFLKRTRLPRRIHVEPAPLEDPNRAWNEERIRKLREKGYDVIEDDSGHFTVVDLEKFKTKS